MATRLKAGDKVQYKVGKGYSEAKIVSIDRATGIAMIESKNGGFTNRHTSKLEKVGGKAKAATPAPVLAGTF
jgi:hypothetical protein